MFVYQCDLFNGYFRINYDFVYFLFGIYYMYYHYDILNLFDFRMNCDFVYIPEENNPENMLLIQVEDALLALVRTSNGFNLQLEPQLR